MPTNKAPVLITALALLCLTACQSNPGSAMQPPLQPCPGTPNCVCSDDTATLHAIEPLRPTGGMDEAWQALSRYLREQPNVTVVSEQPNYLAAEFRTRIMRFVDDVEFEARRDEGVIAMRSASRIGFSDLGANRHRLEQLRSALAIAGVVYSLGSQTGKESKP